ncbi:hypothetical protein ACFU6S_44305 [Streptomyces sp. NPDC057456]|uniref:hypothetical protein n=1 Tax=Streptomyces sp. NPDC057456 TaxID=3346139 RepID=UPI0036A91E1C
MFAPHAAGAVHVAPYDRLSRLEAAHPSSFAATGLFGPRGPAQRRRDGLGKPPFEGGLPKGLFGLPGQVLIIHRHKNGRRFLRTLLPESITLEELAVEVMAQLPDDRARREVMALVEVARTDPQVWPDVRDLGSVEEIREAFGRRCWIQFMPRAGAIEVRDIGWVGLTPC